MKKLIMTLIILAGLLTFANISYATFMPIEHPDHPSSVYRFPDDLKYRTSPPPSTNPPFDIKGFDITILPEYDPYDLWSLDEYDY